MRAKDRPRAAQDPENNGSVVPAEPTGETGEAFRPGLARPLLMVDIDGVISLFGGPPLRASASGPMGGSFHSIDGIPHFLSSIAAAHLLELSIIFDMVWASGWEEKADEHLPRLLGLPAGLPHLSFERSVGRSNAHWKLDAIEAHAAGRALAWLDDALDEDCRRWARERPAPTLLVQTEPTRGLTGSEAEELRRWALSLPAG